jgi:hypothetical protein
MEAIGPYYRKQSLGSSGAVMPGNPANRLCLWGFTRDIDKYIFIKYNIFERTFNQGENRLWRAVAGIRSPVTTTTNRTSAPLHASLRCWPLSKIMVARTTQSNRILRFPKRTGPCGSGSRRGRCSICIATNAGSSSSSRTTSSSGITIPLRSRSSPTRDRTRAPRDTSNRVPLRFDTLFLFHKLRHSPISV